MRDFLVRFLIVLAFTGFSSTVFGQDPSSDPVLAETDDTTPTATPTATPESDAVANDTSEDVNYDLRLRELEDRVNDLKEEIFRSKSRLFLLRQQILQDNIGGSSILITHNNLLSSRYRLVQVLYSLDGDIIYSANSADGEIPDSREVFNSSTLAGPHNISVQMVLEGHGYGIVSYMDGYTFTQTNSHAFNVDEGQTVIVDVVAYEEGGINRSIEERPDIRFDETSTNTVGDVAAQ